MKVIPKLLGINQPYIGWHAVKSVNQIDCLCQCIEEYNHTYCILCCLLIPIRTQTLLIVDFYATDWQKLTNTLLIIYITILLYFLSRFHGACFLVDISAGEEILFEVELLFFLIFTNTALEAFYPTGMPRL